MKIFMMSISVLATALRPAEQSVQFDLEKDRLPRSKVTERSGGRGFLPV